MMVIMVLTLLSGTVHASQIFPTSNQQTGLSQRVETGHAQAAGIDQESCDEERAGQPLHSDNCCGIFCHFVSPAVYAVPANVSERSNLTLFVPQLIDSLPSLPLRPPILHPIRT